MIQHGGAHDWQYTLNKFMDIDDISADALVSYFRPLEEFIEEIEEDFEYKSGTREDKELEELEKTVLREINAPTTTTTPPPTTAATRVTPSLPNAGNNASQAQFKEKPLEVKSSVYIRAEKPNGPDPSGSSPPGEVPVDKPVTPETLDEAQDDKPKINTSMTIWVVSVVLVAIIAIGTIVIYGRQRCRKTPKNRRYV